MTMTTVPMVRRRWWQRTRRVPPILLRHGDAIVFPTGELADVMSVRRTQFKTTFVTVRGRVRDPMLFDAGHGSITYTDDRDVRILR